MESQLLSVLPESKNKLIKNSCIAVEDSIQVFRVDEPSDFTEKKKNQHY